MKNKLQPLQVFLSSVLIKGQRYISNFKSEKLKKVRSLSGTLTFSILALILASLFLSAFIGFYLTFKSEQRNVFTEQQLIAQNSANKVYDFIQEKSRALEVITRLINPSINSQNDLHANLNHLLGHISDFRHLIVFNYKKEKAARVSRFSQLKIIELEERITSDMFEQTNKRKRYISPVYIDKFTSEPLIILAVPIIDSFKDYQGVLAAEVNLKYLWDLMESLKIGSSNHFYVVDRMGKLIAFTDIARVLREENLANLEIVSGFLSDSAINKISEPFIYKGINNKMVIGTYVSLGIPDWAVITELYITKAYSAVISTVIIAAILMIIIGIIASLIGVQMARRLSLPLVKLTDIAEHITDGKLNLKANLNGPAEIKNLEAAFNKLVIRLRKIIDGLEKRNEYIQAKLKKYTQYMDEVGHGKIDSNLNIDWPEIEIYDPLILLGKQINDTTENLKRYMNESRQTTNKLIKQEKKLQDFSTKILKSNNELEQFMFIVSHDLQGPLKEITSFIDYLTTNYSTILDDKAMEFINKINNVSVSMDGFIKRLLRFSRITTKTRIYKSVDLNIIIKEVVDDLEALINETKTDLVADHLPSVDADAFQMKQLFFNILENAIKYRREGVTPLVKIKLLSDKRDSYNFCEINIIDNGIGLNNSYAEKIFDLYHRSHARSEYDGSGLGLATCRKIIEQHNGIIKAFGREGEGSTIYIKLPVKQIHFE